jgi:DNA-binding MarR family transcriptional regulator
MARGRRKVLESKEGDVVLSVRRVPLALSRRFVQICTAAVAGVVIDHDLTPLEYAALGYLSLRPDLDQNSLASGLGIDRNSAGLTVERLEQKSLLTREINGADRRARQLRLTSRGGKLFKKLQPVAFACQQQILAPLSSAEAEKLLDFLVRIVEGNRVLARPGAGRRKRGSSKKPTKQV